MHDNPLVRVAFDLGDGDSINAELRSPRWTSTSARRSDGHAVPCVGYAIAQEAIVAGSGLGVMVAHTGGWAG